LSFFLSRNLNFDRQFALSKALTSISKTPQVFVITDIREPIIKGDAKN